MSGGTITITNIGALGVDAGTPILNAGEAAILAFGAVRPTPWVLDQQIAIRRITRLALSFDHRLVKNRRTRIQRADRDRFSPHQTRSGSAKRAEQVEVQAGQVNELARVG